MPKCKTTYYLSDLIYDLIRAHGGSRLLEGLVVLAHLGNLYEAAYQVGSSWNQKTCPDPDTLELYPKTPESWQMGVAGIKKRAMKETETHAENIAACIRNLPDEESQQQAIAEYLDMWIL